MESISTLGPFPLLSPGFCTAIPPLIFRSKSSQLLRKACLNHSFLSSCPSPRNSAYFHYRTYFYLSFSCLLLVFLPLKISSQEQGQTNKEKKKETFQNNKKKNYSVNDIRTTEYSSRGKEVKSLCHYLPVNKFQIYILKMHVHPTTTSKTMKVLGESWEKFLQKSQCHCKHDVKPRSHRQDC